MGFWDNVNDELKKAVGEGWTTVKENARIGKLRLKVNSLHRKAEKHFSEIGGKVYEMYNRGTEARTNPLESKDIIHLLAEIRATEQEASEIEALIAKIRSREAAAGRKEAAKERPPEEYQAEETPSGDEGDGGRKKAEKDD